MNKKIKDVIIIGFALFSMFFGAGNLIFPSYLGVTSGSDWLMSFAGFILADVGLILVSIYASSRVGSFQAVVGRAGQKFGLGLEIIIMLCLGPILVIPRTGATTFEMSVEPLVGMSPVVFSILFFALTYMLTIRPTKVMDIIGKFLTPILLIALTILIAKGITSPIGEIQTLTHTTNLFTTGINQGYQTMDAMGLGGITAFIMASFMAKGYTNQKDRVSLTIKASLIAAVGLILVYGGLTYLGATASSLFDGSISQTELLVNITALVLGDVGKVLLAVVVAFACLTTAVGLLSVTAKFFEEVTNGRLKYENLILIICIFSAFGANLGVDQIIAIAAPILSIIYPVIIILVLMSCFPAIFKTNLEFKLGAYTTLVISVLTGLGAFGVVIPVVHELPLAKYGFNWIIPALLSIVIAKLINRSKN